jgi:hypothetical protein
MRSLALPLVLVLVACGGVPFLTPDMRTAADRAREIEPRCKNFTEESSKAMLSPDAIDSVEVAYSYVQSGPVSREARFRGAHLHVKPLPGFSREALTRGLECHEARVLLGRVPAGPDDPYVLEGNWLDIDVDSNGDGFVVSVLGDDLDAARRVLERAQRFGGAPARP